MDSIDENLNILAIPKLKEPKNADDARQQLAAISDLVEKCERMLQHLAAGGFNASSQEIDYWMSAHIQVIGLRNLAYKKLQAFESSQNQPVSKIESNNSSSHVWWQFWK